jgi:hypothetical protein
VREKDKMVKLKRSPAIAIFEVGCTGETVTGEIRLVATIIRASEGLEIRDSGNTAVATMIIERQPSK